MSLLEPSFAGLVVCPPPFSNTALSTTMALLAAPDTTVVMWPPPPGVPITTISPAFTMDCQSPVWPAGPSKATIHSPFAWPGSPISVLCTGRVAPASVAMVLHSTQQPSSFQSSPTKPLAVAAIEPGVAWPGTGPENAGCVSTAAVPR